MYPKYTSWHSAQADFNYNIDTNYFSKTSEKKIVELAAVIRQGKQLQNNLFRV